MSDKPALLSQPKMSITFEYRDARGKVLRRRVEFGNFLFDERMPIFHLEAGAEAKKFWEAVVMMGATEKEDL